MRSEHETDIYYFKKVYRYLTEEQGKKVTEIIKLSGLNQPLVKKLIACTKETIPRMRASTLGSLQDFVKRYKEHVAEIDYVSEFNESAEQIIEENGRGRYVEEKEAQPLTIGEADAFDLLRALSKVSNINMDIVVTMNNIK